MQSASASIEEGKHWTSPLQILLQDTHPERLEMGVDEGFGMLDRLEACMVANLANNPDAQPWVKQLGWCSLMIRAYISGTDGL